MGLTHEDRIKGGKQVAKKYGAEYMRKIGKKGKKKQMQSLKKNGNHKSLWLSLPRDGCSLNGY